MFSSQIDDLFVNANHAGDVPQFFSQTASVGDASRAAVRLFVSTTGNQIEARYLVTGGVVLIACCEYWARQTESGVVLSDDPSQWMYLLDIDPIWRCDVALVVSAVMSL